MGNFATKEFLRGQVIFKDGDKGDCLYEIVRGTVDIYKEYGEKGEKKLTTIETGAYFGEMGLIDNMPRSATAVAGGDCELVIVSESEFADYLQQNPETALKIMRTLSTRVRGLTADFMEACGVIAEALEADEKKKSKSLLGRLKKFADVYMESCKALSEMERINISEGRDVLFYDVYRSWY